MSYGAGADTTGVVIVKDGKIIGERYRQGFDLHTESRTWSAAKSITGTLVGIAVKQGLLKVDAPADTPSCVVGAIRGPRSPWPICCRWVAASTAGAVAIAQTTLTSAARR